MKQIFRILDDGHVRLCIVDEGNAKGNHVLALLVGLAVVRGVPSHQYEYGQAHKRRARAGDNHVELSEGEIADEGFRRICGLLSAEVF